MALDSRFRGNGKRRFCFNRSPSDRPTDDEIFHAPNEGSAFEPAHPGEIFLQELHARDLTAHASALKLRAPANRLTEILDGKRGLSAETALRLSRHLGPSAAFWFGLQTQDDLARRYGRRWMLRRGPAFQTFRPAGQE